MIKIRGNNRTEESGKGNIKRFRPRLPARFQKRFNKKPRKMSLASMVPNIVTILALCSGLTAVQMALLNRWDLSIVAILFAGFLDGMDGRLARMLGSSSRFGAELDSFSDLISFGAAPAIVIYMRTLHQWGETGWGICLFFTVCMALRLARFNTSSIEGNTPSWTQGFFTGVPAPAAAYIALLPLIMQQYFTLSFLFKPLTYAIVVLITGGLMVSRIPTFSLKKVIISHRFVLPLMLIVFLTIAAIYVQPWLVLSIIGILYIMMIPFSVRAYNKLHKSVNSEDLLKDV